MRVLIAGCGYVGTVFGQLLAKQGHTAFGMRRNPALLPDGIDGIRGDLRDLHSLKNLPEALDAVVFCASAGGFSERTYRSTYVDGTRNLLDAVKGKTKEICRTVFVSSTGVYGQQNGEWVNEDSETTPLNFSGKIMLEGEAIVKANCSLPLILRFGGIYGPGRDRLVRLVRGGDLTVKEDSRYTNRIYRDDGAAAILHLLTRKADHTIYNVVDEYPASYREVIGWIAKRLSVELPSEIGGDDTVTVRGGNKRVSSARLLSSGFRFQYPDFRSGYTEILLREMEEREREHNPIQNGDT